MKETLTKPLYKKVRLLCLLMAFACLPFIGKAQSSSVDFGLAINGSGSISSTDFSIQIQGITQALQNPLIFPRNGSIGFTLVQYASGSTQIHVPYTVINNEADVANIIQTIQNIRQISGSTNPGDGIARVMGELVAKGDPNNDQFICLSTDGIRNSGIAPSTAISNAKANGLDRFSVLAIEDPPFALAADFNAAYGSLVFGGGAVTVVTSFLEYANILGASCLTVDLELRAIEVTQVVQNWQNDVRLIENKETLVRAFVQSRDTNSAPAQARLRAYRNGVELAGSPLTAANSGSFVAPPKTTVDADLIARHGKEDQALNFEIPLDWASGSVTFEVEGLGTSLTCAEMAGTPNDCEVTVTFDPSKELELALYNIIWIDNNGNANASMNNELLEIQSRMVSTYPLDDITFSLRNMRMVSAVAPTFDEILDQMILVREANNITSTSPEPQYFGNAVNVSNEGLTDRAGGVAASNQAAEPHVSSHELGHLQSLAHIDACGTGSPYDPFPHFNAAGKPTLGDNQSGPETIMYGFNSREDSILSPFTFFELMSYCVPLWTSGTTYERLYNNLPAAQGNAAPNLLASAAYSPVIASSHAEDFWLFRGSIDLDNQIASFQPTMRFMDEVMPITPNTGPYQLQLLDDGDNVLSTLDFEVNERSGLGSTRANTGSFILPVSYNANGAKIRIIYSGNVIGELVASNAQPTINVTSPNGGESLNGPVTFTWDASDADNDPLTYVVMYSADGGTNWQTLAVDWPFETFDLDASELEETSTGLIRVYASDGFNVAVDDSDGTFITPNSEPQGSIQNPTNGAVFVGVQTVICTGSGYDLEDGALPPANLAWYSDLNGFLGNGEDLNIPASNLIEGIHQLSLEVTDSKGAVSSTSVQIEILRFPRICSITGVSLGAEAVCNEGGTFSQEVIITYDDAPSTGTLMVNDQPFPISGSPQAVILTDLPVSGTDIDLDIYFSAEPTCQLQVAAAFEVPAGCKAAVCGATGNILYQRWNGTSGKTLMDVPFDEPADEEWFVTEFRTPVNSGLLFGSRIAGYLCPPESGYYIFKIAGDDQAALYLSTDATADSAQRIAETLAWTYQLEYDKYPSQISDSVWLEAGRAYYIEGRHSEGGGQDHMSVGWVMPDGTDMAVIPGDYLSPEAVLPPSNLRPADSVANPVSGLYFEYFEGTYDNLPDFDNLYTACFGTVETVQPAVGRRDILYAQQLSGYYYAPTDGQYTFYLGSDDGSRMYLGDSLFIDNSGLHPYQEEFATIGLSAGYHAISIDFFNKFGPDDLTLFVREPGGLKMEVPGSSLVYEESWITYRMADNVTPTGNGIRYTLYHYGETDPIAEGVQEMFDLSRSLRRSQYRLEWNGYIEVPQTGIYAFYTETTTELSLSIGGNTVVPINQEYGCIALEAGLHEISAMYDAKNSDGYYDGIQVSWSGPGIALQEIPASVLYYTGEIEGREPDIRQGLQYTYYQQAFDAGLEVLPDFDMLTPDKEGVVSNITLSVKERDNRYGLVFEGFIKAPKTSDYRFTLSSDDGSRLYIGDTELIDNDGRHPVVSISRLINLEEGLHRIRVEYFQHWGYDYLNLKWSIPNQFEGTVPDSVLYYLVPGAEGSRIQLASHRVISEQERVAVPGEGDLLSLYPNPAEDRVILESADMALGQAEVELISMDGRSRTLLTGSRMWRLSDSKLELSLEGLSPGLYMVRVVTPEADPVTLRLMKR